MEIVECNLSFKNCNECMKNSPYPFCCRAECGEHEYCSGCNWPNNRSSSNNDSENDLLKKNSLLTEQIRELSNLVRSKNKEIASLTSHIKYLEDKISSLVEEDDKAMLDVLRVIMEEEENQIPAVHINTPNIIINIG